jgi:hypothetical protein
VGRPPTAAATATPADRGGRRRAARPRVPRSKTPTNGAELRKQSLKISALPVWPSGAVRSPVGLPCSHFAHRRCAYSWTPPHTSVVNLQVRRTSADASVRHGTGWSGSNPGIPTSTAPRQRPKVPTSRPRAVAAASMASMAASGPASPSTSAYRSGMVAPAANAELETLMGSGRARSARGAPPPDEHAANPATLDTSSHRIGEAYAGPSTLMVDSPRPARTTTISAGSAEGLLSRCTTPLGT